MNRVQSLLLNSQNKVLSKSLPQITRSIRNKVYFDPYSITQEQITQLKNSQNIDYLLQWALSNLNSNCALTVLIGIAAEQILFPLEELQRQLFVTQDSVRMNLILAVFINLAQLVDFSVLLQKFVNHLKEVDQIYLVLTPISHLLFHTQKYWQTANITLLELFELDIAQPDHINAKMYYELDICTEYDEPPCYYLLNALIYASYYNQNIADFLFTNYNKNIICLKLILKFIEHSDFLELLQPHHLQILQMTRNKTELVKRTGALCVIALTEQRIQINLPFSCYEELILFTTFLEKYEECTVEVLRELEWQWKQMQDNYM
ncbi:Hypothetical_protein [Hexamita inflata]|uniref:Hypothetical_protein n=1 Tax=Hexamita inflata TaxID=28002 RepID=A0AA86PPS8_9EUKA|nr:Hypothetical protein HINF_LOCUS30208 [Hexamita inflata]